MCVSNPYSANIFVLKMMSVYCVCCMYSDALQTDFITEANTMNPVQTLEMGSCDIVCNFRPLKHVGR